MASDQRKGVPATTPEAGRGEGVRDAKAEDGWEMNVSDFSELIPRFILLQWLASCYSYLFISIDIYSMHILYCNSVT